MSFGKVRLEADCFATARLRFGEASQPSERHTKHIVRLVILRGEANGMLQRLDCIPCFPAPVETGAKNFPSEGVIGKFRAHRSGEAFGFDQVSGSVSRQQGFDSLPTGDAGLVGERLRLRRAQFPFELDDRFTCQSAALA